MNTIQKISVGLLALSAAVVLMPQRADVYAIGDSIIWWGAPDGRSIADSVAGQTNLEVINAAIPGAEFLSAEDSIPQQYKTGLWDWVILNGGANDLHGVCGTSAAPPVLDALIGPDLQTGAMPAFINRVLGDGHFVVVVGYYFAPDGGGEFQKCDADFAQLNMRLEGYADAQDGVFYVAAADVIDTSDVTFYHADMLHPSARASRVIGAQVAAIINAATR